MVNPSLNRYLNRGNISYIYGNNGATQPATVGAPEQGVSAAINVGGFELQGRLSAAFLGTLVIALAGFYLVTRGLQL